MFKILVKFLFTVITKLFSIILAPIVLTITALFPDLSTILTNVLNFFNNYVFLYLGFLVKLLENLTFLPHTLIVFLFDYYMIKYTIYLTVLAVRFGINVYNKLKV